jgi:hypothetical protein
MKSDYVLFYSNEMSRQFSQLHLELSCIALVSNTTFYAFFVKFVYKLRKDAVLARGRKAGV